MILAHSMPAATLALPGTAVFLSADAGSALIDGKPGRRTLIRWRNDGTPTTAHTVSPALIFPAAAQIRVVAILGTSIPAGVAVSVYGRRTIDAGRTYDFGGLNTGTIQQFADGSRGVWFVLPAAATAVIELEFRIANNNGGATWASAATEFTVGELVAMPAIEHGIRDGWTISTIDPSPYQWTRGSQRVGIARRTYRQLTAQFSPMETAKVRGNGLANGTDLERVCAALTGNARAIAIPQWKTNGVQDSALIQRTAIYGSASEIPGATNIQLGIFDAPIVFDEVPG